LVPDHEHKFVEQVRLRHRFSPTKAKSSIKLSSHRFNVGAPPLAADSEYLKIVNINDLPTPSLLVDRSRLDRNIARMNAKARSLGISLRPHLKTAKSAAIARLATDGGNYGITVSTLKEAEYFAEHGFSDITYAVGIVPSKLDQAARLQANGADLKIMTDNERVAREIATHGAPFRVLIEVDSGDARAGVQADGEDLLAVAGALGAARHAQLVGVLTHAGHAYGVATAAEVARIAEDERLSITRSAQRLRDAGHDIQIVSAGSTPTALFAENAQGLTEVRAGVYVFFDLDQQSRGVCARDEVALSVLASVIGHNRTAGKILLDSGGLALSKDIGANAFRPDVGYGEVCHIDTAEPIGNLSVTSVSQEHGHVQVTSDDAYESLPVGSKVRILPNHACMTAAAYERYYVIGDGVVVDEWDRINGW
jgi:D-serine deaminase-like pyridoxal phosphate-dependent protein